MRNISKNQYDDRKTERYIPISNPDLHVAELHDDLLVFQRLISLRDNVISEFPILSERS